MQDELKKQKIKQFLNDKLMSVSVKEVLRESFLKARGERDVYKLASERMAIDLLEEGFKDLSKIALKEEKSQKISEQPGL